GGALAFGGPPLARPRGQRNPRRSARRPHRRIDRGRQSRTGLWLSPGDGPPRRGDRPAVRDWVSAPLARPLENCRLRSIAAAFSPLSIARYSDPARSSLRAAGATATDRRGKESRVHAVAGALRLSVPAVFGCTARLHAGQFERQFSAGAGWRTGSS